MSLSQSFLLSGLGLQVQKKRIDVVAENLANASSTRTADGGPYRKKELIISSTPVSFEKGLEKYLKKDQVQGAQVIGVSRSDSPPRIVYDPAHPDADANGNVALPNISTVQEMVDLITASKAYQANVTVFNAGKSMVMRTLDLGRA